ncbi:MAG: ABC transporter permease [Desulfuromonadales bacterium]|nr:ABC transporter permease [Desulfuromonadales bacterium]MBN2791858.1 ABC transporter permease [Desulfuromonadales bacterium]
MYVLRRIMALIKKEFMVILRDPKSRFVVIGPPLIQFFFFGYAATFDVTNVRYALLDQDRTSLSRELAADFSGSENFQLVRYLNSIQEIDDAIDSQDVRIVIHIEENFTKKLLTDSAATVQVIADGRNSNVASVALGYAENIISKFNQDQLSGGGSDPSKIFLSIDDRAWFNSNLLSRWYIVAPLGGTISMVIVMILTSLSVAREREFGTFDQLLVAPFTPGEILLAKSLPGIIFGLIDSMLLVAGSVWWFGLPFKGSIIALVLIMTLFMISIVGIGLLVSSLSMTMQQALLGSFAFIMPAVVLSGFTTPIENMPQWLQTGTLANPLRYIVTALRWIFLEGAGIADVWPQMWPLMIIAALTLPPAAWLFRHRVG